MNVKELLELSAKSTTADLVPLPTEMAKERVKPKKCVVYWVDEKKVSRVALSAICRKEEAKEGCTTDIMWGGNGPYIGRIVKISSNLNELKEIEKKLEKDLCEHLNDDQPGPLTTTSSGRPVKRPLKIGEISEEEDVAAQDTSAQDTCTSAVAQTTSAQTSASIKRNKKSATEESQLAAKLRAKQAMCQNLFTGLSNNDNLLPSTSVGLDGLVRAVEVINNTDIIDLPDPSFHDMDSFYKEENDKLIYENDVLRKNLDTVTIENMDLKSTNFELSDELEALKVRVVDLEEKLCSKSDLQPATGLAVTPRKVQFLKELTSFAESITSGVSASSTSAPLTEALTCTVASSRSPEPLLPSVQPTTYETVSRSDQVELVKGTGVFVALSQRTSLLMKGKKGPSIMMRKLLDVLFTKEELGCGCAVGGRPSAVNKLQGGMASMPLNSDKLNAAKAFILCYCKKNGTPVPAEKELNCVINSKCVETRRQNRKISGTA